MTKVEVWVRRGRGQNKRDGRGGAGCKLTQRVVVGAQEDGNTGKTFPFVLEHLNVASGQGLGQRGSLSPRPGQPLSQPQRRASGLPTLDVRNLSIPLTVSTQPLSEARPPSRSPRALSPPQAAFCEEHELHPVAFLSGC